MFIYIFHKNDFYWIEFILLKIKKLLIITNNADTLLSNSVSWKFVQKANGQAVLVLALGENGKLWFLLISLLVHHRNSHITLRSLLSRAKLKNNVNIIFNQQCRAKFASWTGWDEVKYNYEPNYVLYLFVLFWYYCICILSRTSCTEVLVA